MKTLAGEMLTTRGVAAFWLLWSLAFVLMLWAAAPPEPNPSPGKLLKPLGVGGNAGAEEVAVDWPKPLIGAQRRSVWHLLRGDNIDAICRCVAAKGML